MFQRISKLSIALVLATGVLVTPASAADLYVPTGGSLKDEPYVAPFTWTGFYFGGHAGLGVGDTDGTPETFTFAGATVPIPGAIGSFFSTDYDMSGALYGGHIGYNYQTGAFVIGIEGTFTGSSINGDGPSGVGLIVSERDINWLATVTGRLGYAMGRSLIYAKAGVVWGDVDSSVRLGGITVLDGGETHFGWTVGFGYEHALTDHISVRVEYAHIDLGSDTHNLSYNGVFGGPAGIASVGSDVDVVLDTLTLGVSYKF